MARETFPEQPAETKTNDKNQTAQLRLLLREVGMIVKHDCKQQQEPYSLKLQKYTL